MAKCPPIFINPRVLNNSSNTAGIVWLHLDKGEGHIDFVKMEIPASLSVGLAGRGFIHLHPTKEQVAEIIEKLQRLHQIM